MNRIQLATTGLFAAWMAHDLEELATLSGNSRILMTRLPGWLPMPTSAREQGVTRRYVASGVAAVGLVVAVAAAHGCRTQGRSALYQNALLGFGLHGLGHLGTSLLTRSYASGVATSPTIVLGHIVASVLTNNRPLTTKRGHQPPKRHAMRVISNSKTLFPA